MRNKKIVYLALLILSLVIVIRSLASSLFFKNNNRINLAVLTESGNFYSLGIKDGLNYNISFPTDLKIQIPGGYSYYRVGAFQKLISLEKKPEILQKAFSYAASAIVEYYFIPRGQVKIHYDPEDTLMIGRPSLWKIFFYKSNANFFDRVYLAINLSLFNRDKFQQIKDYPTKNERGEKTLLTDEFFKKLQGYFYNKTYREENKNVQIIYTKKYSSALVVSQVIEGSGIKVADISVRTVNREKCVIIEEKVPYSRTAKDLAKFLGCNLEKGGTEISDIIVELGNKEDSWEL